MSLISKPLRGSAEVEYRLRSDLSFAQVDSLLRIDDTGVLRWRERRGSRNPDIEAGHTDNKGYRCVGLLGGRYYVHRVIWLLCYKEWPNKLIDHIDGNPLNNRIENLRLATYSQNTSNRRGVTGITLHPCGRFQAQIKTAGKSIYLGLYPTEALAVAAYREASERIHGEYGARR